MTRFGSVLSSSAWPEGPSLDPRHPDFGGVFDGTRHPLSELYGSLGAAQADGFPFAQSLLDQRDGLSIEKALRSVPYTKRCSVMLPPGLGLVSYPIVSNKPDREIIGSHVASLKAVSRVDGEGNAGFPVISMQGSPFGIGEVGPGQRPDIEVQTSLVSGPGNAYTMVQHLARTLPLEGLHVSQSIGREITAFNWEFFFVCTDSDPSEGRCILSWCGQGAGLDLANLPSGIRLAFWLSTDANGDDSLWAQCHIGAADVQIYSAYGSVAQDTVYWCRLNYDGSNVRLYLGIPGQTATLVGTVAATGLWEPSPFESLELGCRNAWPYGASISVGMQGAVDGLRFDWTSRYTGGTVTAPSEKTTPATWDANTVMICNFEEPYLQFVKYRTYYWGNGLFQERRGDAGGGNGLASGQRLIRVNIDAGNGTGVTFVDVQNPFVENLEVRNAGICLDLNNNCYQGKFSHLTLLGTRFPLLSSQNCTVAVYSDVEAHFANKGCAIVLRDSAASVVRDVYSFGSAMEAYIGGDTVSMSLENWNTGDENSPNVGYGTVCVGVRNMSIRDMRTWYHGPKPSVTISGGEKTSLIACDFRHEDPETVAAVHVVDNQTYPVRSLCTTVSGAGDVPLCDPEDQLVEI
jgi:hypothetical protein